MVTQHERSGAEREHPDAQRQDLGEAERPRGGHRGGEEREDRRGIHVEEAVAVERRAGQQAASADQQPAHVVVERLGRLEQRRPRSAAPHWAPAQTRGSSRQAGNAWARAERVRAPRGAACARPRVESDSPAALRATGDLRLPAVSRPRATLPGVAFRCQAACCGLALPAASVRTRRFQPEWNATPPAAGGRKPAEFRGSRPRFARPMSPRSAEALLPDPERRSPRVSQRYLPILLLALGLLGARLASADTISFQDGALLPGGGTYTGTQDTEIRGTDPATALGSGGSCAPTSRIRTAASIRKPSRCCASTPSSALFPMPFPSARRSRRPCSRSPSPTRAMRRSETSPSTR